MHARRSHTAFRPAHCAPVLHATPTRRSRAGILACLCAAFVLTQGVIATPASRTSPARPAAAARPVLLAPAFTDCEQRSFVALAAARRAMEGREDRSAVQALAGTDPGAKRMIDALYAEVRKGGQLDHTRFAARELAQCTQRARLQLPAGDASACLARLDVVHFVVGERSANRAQAQALSAAMDRFANDAKRPPELVELVVPAVYRLRTAEDRFSLEQILFESCQYPEQWKARVDATPASTGPSNGGPPSPHGGMPGGGMPGGMPGMPGLPPRHPPITPASPHG